MRQLTNALVEAREGTGEVRSVLLSAAFRPRLPGLTKLVSKLSKEGSWRKALEVFETVEELGVRPDTALTNSAISACDKGGRWQKALEIFDRMDKLRLPRDAITYSATISALAKGKQWHAALQVFDHMQSSGVEADVVTCCSLINALERGGQWQLAEKLFLQMCTVQEHEGGISTDMVNPFMSHELSPNAQSILSRTSNNSGYGFGQHGMQHQPLLRSQTSPTSVLLALRNNSCNPPASLPPVSETNPVQVDSGSSLPTTTSTGPADTLPRQDSGQVYGNCEPLPDAVDGLASVFARAATLSPSPSQSPGPVDPSTLNPFSLAAAQAQHGSTSSLSSLYHPSFGLGQGLSDSVTDLQLLHLQDGSHNTGTATATATPPSRLQRSGSLRPDPSGASAHAAAAAHLRRAISCFPDLDPVDGVGEQTQIFNFSHAAKVAPNRVCCNALLAAYARAKPPQWQKAIHLLSAMWSGGPTLTPDAVSYNTVLKACANSFQVSRAIEVYREMVSRCVVPNATTFNCLIAAAGDAGSAEALREIGMWLEAAPHEVRAACMNAYVSGLVKIGSWEEGLRAYRDMLAPGSPAHPTAATFNVIMSGFMQAGDYDAVRLTFDEMRASGVTPTIVAYNTLLAALAAVGGWREALDVLNLILMTPGEGVTPNTSTFNTVLTALASGAATANGRPNHPLIASKAVQVYQQMQSTGSGHGSAPDAASYAALVSVFESTGHLTQMVAIHDLMSSSGIVPDATTATKILSAAVATGQTARAVQLAHALQLRGIALDSTVITSLLSSCTQAGAWDLASQLCSAARIGQGEVAAAAMYNFVLQSALARNQYTVAMELLTMMQSCGLQVEPSTAAQILGEEGRGINPTVSGLEEKEASPPSSGSALGAIGPASLSQEAESSRAEDVLKDGAPGEAEFSTPVTPALSSSPGANISPGL